MALVHEDLEEPNKVLLEDSITQPETNPQSTSRALRSARKKLKRLERQIERLSEDQKVSGSLLAKITELNARITELEAQNALLSASVSEPAQTVQEPTPIVPSAPIKEAPTSQIDASETSQTVREEDESLSGKEADEKNTQSAEHVPLSKLVKDIWVQRTLLLASGIVLGTLLLAYSIIFVDTYKALGNTTSYFPWAWRTNFTDAASSQDMFIGAEAISLIAIGACAVTLWLTLPRLRKAISQSSVTPAQNVTPEIVATVD
jgi:small-conductance mechanosensitive channel